MSALAQPLSGIRILDLSWVGAGPYVTRPLSALGADVIKVESGARLDPVRMMRPFAHSVPGLNRSGYFANRNPQKRSITLNLKTPDGLDVARRLVRASDVIVNNFRPGVMDRLGLGWGDVAELNPQAIYLEMPMQGTVGPHASYVGYGLTLAALSGLYLLSGEPGQPPVGTGTNFPDHVPNPLHATGAILCALRLRAVTGAGLRIELSQFESTVRIIGPAVVAASAGVMVQRRGNSGWGWSPHAVFPCARRASFVAIVVRSDDEWDRLCDVLDCAEWASDESPFRTQAQRWRRREELERLVAAKTADRDGVALALELSRSAVPAAVVENARTLLDRNDQLREREHWVRLDHPEMGCTVYDSLPYRLDGRAVTHTQGAPLLGEHTDEVCTEVLSMTADELAELHRSEAIA
jgi:benzylsuccinate CoA-transferase BbsF subunit